MINGPDFHRFPDTQFSAVEGLKSEATELRTKSLDRLVAIYWRPVYKYVRVKYRQGIDDAQDFTQGFFTRAFEKQFLVDFDTSKGRFRTFLRTCLDRYIANEFKHNSRIKRGGHTQLLSLDFEGAERELQSTEAASVNPIDAYFEQEWIRSVLAQALNRLEERAREQGKEVHLKLFQSYDLDGFESDQKITYQQLAEQYRLKTTEVTNYLADMRRQFREITLEIIREITSSEDEFRDEVRAVLGIHPR